MLAISYLVRVLLASRIVCRWIATKALQQDYGLARLHVPECVVTHMVSLQHEHPDSAKPLEKCLCPAKIGEASCSLTGSLSKSFLKVYMY